MARYAWLYQLKPGAGEHADAIFQAGGGSSPEGLAGPETATVFRQEDTLAQVLDADGDSSPTAADPLTVITSITAFQPLMPLLSTDADLTTEEGLRRFLGDRAMTLITHRQAQGLPRALEDLGRYAVTFSVKPGAEVRAAEILSGYDPPQARIDEDTWLVGTTVFIKGTVVVRVMDVHGSLPKIMAHLSRQPVIQAVEEALNPLLLVPRDMSTADGARAFFMQAMMRPIAHRIVAQ